MTELTDVFAMITGGDRRMVIVAKMSGRTFGSGAEGDGAKRATGRPGDSVIPVPEAPELVFKPESLSGSIFGTFGILMKEKRLEKFRVTAVVDISQRGTFHRFGSQMVEG